MAKNDVVEHKLKVNADTVWDLASSEPIPFPRSKGGGVGEVLTNPSVDTMIVPPTIDTPPYQSVGKVGVRFDPLTPTKAGSGWVIAPRAFITAGHCVYFKDLGGWIDEGRFCPRYNVECEGTLYIVETVYTLQGWIDDGDDRQYDMAACVVTAPFTGAEPPLAFAVNELIPLQISAIGYPGKPNAAHQFNGKRMWRADGNTLHMANGVITAENDLTTGASGGPWCDPQDNWKVNGLTAARDDDPNTALSPYFTTGIQNLYNAVRNL